MSVDEEEQMAEGEETTTIDAPEAPTSAAEPTAPAAEAPASGQQAAAAEPDEFAGFDEATKKRVSEIVSKRINGLNARFKPYETFGKPEELQQRLTRAEQLEKWADDMRQRMAGQQRFPGQDRPADQPMSDQDKQVLSYMERLMPGFSKMREELQYMRTSLQTQDQFRWEQISRTNQGVLGELAEKAGYAAEHVMGSSGLEQHVANSILANREDYVKYMRTGDPAIVKKHFEAVDKWVKGLAPKPPAPPVAAGAKLAADKAKTQRLPPRLPAAGVPAPTAGKRKLTDAERVNGAFDAWKNA